MSTIYRVIQRTTANYTGSGTRWQMETVYCGSDREQALIAYYRHQPQDRSRGHGFAATETFIEQIDVGDDPAGAPPPARILGGGS